MTDVEELGRWLLRLLAPGRFGPMILGLRDGARLDVRRREDIRVHVSCGTIEVATDEGWREILLEDVLAIGLRPRSPAPPEPEGDGFTTRS